jgi:dihydrofolate reductase
MVKLIYSPIASLDGYVEDEQGKFDWAAPDDEVHAFVNELERPIGTYLYGRRMYETMVFWETVSGGADQPAVIRDFAEIWRAAEKIVFSRALQTVATPGPTSSTPSTLTRFGASRKPREPTSRSGVPS